MSNEAITWAYNECSPLIKRSGALFVLVTLSNWSDQAGEAWGKQETIAARTAQGERTVREHLAWLEEKGFISKLKRRSSGGQALGDGFILDPGDKHGLLAILEKKSGEAEGHVSAWREEKRREAERQAKRPNPPDGSRKPTGEICRSNRRNLPVQPAKSAGTYNEDTKETPKDTGAGAAGTAPPTDRPDGPVDAAAPERVEEKPPPANRRWKACEQVMADHFGRDWGAWLKPLIVLTDDGETLVLGAPTQAFVAKCRGFVSELQRILERRRVEVRIYNLSQLSAGKRAAEQEAARQEAARAARQAAEGSQAP